MLACRHQHHRLVFLARASSRSFSASSCSSSPSSSGSPSSSKPKTPPSPSQDSIFTAPESPWDHVFADIDTMPPLLPTSMRNPLRQTHHSPFSKSEGEAPGSNGKPVLGRASTRSRRQAMTAREISAFDEMFNMIFNAVSGQKSTSPHSSSASSPTSASSPLSALDTPSIGRTPPTGISGQGAPLNDLFRTLRRHSSRVPWTSAIDEELDRKKEEMDLCDTDQELLEWAMREVFAESVKWGDEAKKALAASASSNKNTDLATPSTPPASTLPALQPPTYPHLLAHLMRLFRTTYHNPSLALSIFTHASRLSIPSYVFGCTAPAYNELIQAKWEGWGDLEGVCKALEEMRGNGVRGDGRTRLVVERVRREVGEARGEGGNPLARRLWADVGEAGVMRLLTRIEELALRDPPRKQKLGASKKGWKGQESWKSAVLKSDNEDGWEFDSWRRAKKERVERRGGEEKFGANRRRSEGMQDASPFDDWMDVGTTDENVAYR
ncbi:hypothetical protein HYDPIDRAFT_149148 [Hydnomerulius pinastri MD-312]|nr:hypothetical protein HYDPIDRAFT_149148 [Hydnomerulius pinastri MD-312]